MYIYMCIYVYMRPAAASAAASWAASTNERNDNTRRKSIQLICLLNLMCTELSNGMQL